MTLHEKKIKKIYLSLEKLSLKGKDNYIEFHKYVDELVSKGDYNALIEVLYTYYFFEPGASKSVDELKKSAWKEICFQTSTPFLKKLKKIYDQKKVYQNSFDIYSTDLTRYNLDIIGPLTSTFSNSSSTYSISISKGDSNVVLETNSEIHSIDIYQVKWNELEPLKEKKIKSVTDPSGVIDTEIPINSVNSYLITTEKRIDGYEELNYKLNITQSTFLGKIIEREIFTPDTKYYLINKQYANIIESRKTYLEVYKYGYATASIFAYDDSKYSEEHNLLVRYTQAIDFLNY